MLDISNRITPISLSHDTTIKKKVHDGKTIDGMANKTSIRWSTTNMQVAGSIAGESMSSKLT